MKTKTAEAPKTFSLVLNPDERRALLALAVRDDRRPGALLRVLLRREAYQAGLLASPAFVDGRRKRDSAA